MDSDLLTRLATILGIVDSSNFEGEQLNALQTASRLLRKSGLRWPDLLEGQNKAEIAIEAASVLLSELNEAKRQLTEYEKTVKVEDWSEVGDQSPRDLAKWCLELHPKHVLLNKFELDFLKTVASWRGSLTQKQEPILERILQDVIRLSRRRP